VVLTNLVYVLPLRVSEPSCLVIILAGTALPNDARILRSYSAHESSGKYPAPCGLEQAFVKKEENNREQHYSFHCVSLERGRDQLSVE
jgi:hypothetical protein